MNVKIETATLSHAGSALRWPVPEEFLTSPAVAYRNRFAENLAERPVEQLVESYVYLSCAQMEKLLRTAYRSTGIDGLKGTGIELGAGCGLLSATVAKAAGVDRWCLYSAASTISSCRTTAWIS
jgi:hypothetical protein